MSMYSDYECGALTDQEFDWVASREEAMDRAREESFYPIDDEEDEEA